MDNYTCGPGIGIRFENHANGFFEVDRYVLNSYQKSYTILPIGGKSGYSNDDPS
jgi:hypothetical protein